MSTLRVVCLSFPAPRGGIVELSVPAGATLLAVGLDDHRRVAAAFLLDDARAARADHLEVRRFYVVRPDEPFRANPEHLRYVGLYDGVYYFEVIRG